MSKPTFQPLDRDGNPTGNPVPFTPVIVVVGTQTHRLALHREITQRFLPTAMREWSVSHPIIGAKVFNVVGTYKGVPCSTRGFTLTQARAAAMAQFDRLIERIGSDAFNAKIASFERESV